MLAGTSVMLLLYGTNWIQGIFSPYYLMRLDPLMWGVPASLVTGITVSLLTRAPEAEHLAKCFDADP
jgi:hypothetical protein